MLAVSFGTLKGNGSLCVLTSTGKEVFIQCHGIREIPNTSHLLDQIITGYFLDFMFLY